MKIAIIGRTEILYNTAVLLAEHGHKIVLVVTSKEAAEYTVTAEDFKVLAEKHNSKFIHTAKINEGNIIEKIRSLGNIDLAVSINYSGVIAQEVIDLFKIGILNAHGGDLPRYRGNACQAWAILNGEKKIGLCIHKMIGGELDSGNILARDYFKLEMNSRIGEVYEWFNIRIPELMLEVVLKLQANSNYVLEEQSKDISVSLRCYPRHPEDGKINWTDTNENIIRLINASSEPYQGAFCFLSDEKVIIWRAEAYEDKEPYLAVPGQVCEINNKSGHVIIACGKGKIKLLEIQIDSQRSVPSNFIKSIRQRLK
jgi:methionyl-tRNA formyltransferase